MAQTQPSPNNVYNEIETLSGWYRYLSTPGHREAENYIFSKFEDYGLNTSRQEYTGQRQDGDVRCVNIIGMLDGAHQPNKWLVIGGHYDAQKYSTSAAYDNAAGASTVIELARYFSDYYQTHEGPEISILFATWDAEEGGGAGSSYFVNNLPENIKVVAYINLDMFSLNYPIRNNIPGSNEQYYKLYLYTSPVEDFSRYDKSDYNESTLENFTIFKNLLMEITYQKHNFPPEWVLVLDDTQVASDHSFFIRDSIPAVWFRGMHEYPKDEGDLNERNFKHTPVDTLEAMELYAGSKTELLKGIDTGLTIAYDLAVGVLNLSSVENQTFSGFQEPGEGGNVPGLGTAGCLIAAVIVLIIFIGGYFYWKRTKKGNRQQ